ncbi:hypothetical protein WQ57_18410 [Mesobacillus campisalis]|uniref:Aminoglycoside phosphotransferase domain-containing protein n=1 Tax=Mesobacillus campisalis TaxID=1408103 RepID=A0A0M2SSE7_9BACI|nr:phosphotransferase [Mesobacillus campisalis]KKK36621.1 hypothetical protein WQ57_18410 [Mesobacillus campisalis]
MLAEELITFHPTKDWVDEDLLKVMEDVFNRYYHYFCSCLVKGTYPFVTPISLFKSVPNNRDTIFIWSEIEADFQEMNVPMLRLHGDLWTANTLLDKSVGEIYFIDWEFSNYLFFFYDFFNMMWVEFYINKNDLFLNQYVNGEYDHEMERAFTLFGLDFKQQARMSYFNLYFLNYYAMRLTKMDLKSRKAYIKQYKKLLRQIKCRPSIN